MKLFMGLYKRDEARGEQGGGWRRHPLSSMMNGQGNVQSCDQWEPEINADTEILKWRTHQSTQSAVH